MRLAFASIRSGFAVVLVLTACAFLAARAQPKQDVSASVSISLPAGVRSETVQIVYHMSGTFGGYGGYTKPQPDLRAYRIDASVEGRPADAIKIIAYATGCAIQTFDLSFARDASLQVNFLCEALPEVRLTGQIPSDLIQGRNAEVLVTYVAFWANEFCGISDGAVPEFRLALVSPDEKGTFSVSIPDFSSDKRVRVFQRYASLRLILRDAKTWNGIAPDLVPELPECKSEGIGLKIASSYPDTLKFVPNPNWQ